MNFKKIIIFLTIILTHYILLIEARSGFGAALGGGLLGSFVGTSIANTIHRPHSQTVETQYIEQPRQQQPTIVVVQQPAPVTYNPHQTHVPPNNQNQHKSVKIERTVPQQSTQEQADTHPEIIKLRAELARAKQELATLHEKK